MRHDGAWLAAFHVMRAIPEPHNLLNSRREDTELPFGAAVANVRPGSGLVTGALWGIAERRRSENRRFSEVQIRSYLAEAASGVPVRELCARYGFSDASFYGWRTRFGQAAQGDAKEGQKLRELQEENALLKSMLADALLKLELLRNRTGRSGKDR